jgi:SAM-dependent methyltransferase
MTTTVFGPEYASAYDLLYADKDYAREVDIVEALVGSQLPPGPWSFLDLGCGTGRHAVLLATRGHEVVGIDLAPDMLTQARHRAGEALQGIDFRQGDVRRVRVGRQFDVVLLMFAVLGYQLSDDDVAATLRTASTHVGEGGLVIFDVWYRPAVEAVGPSPRVKEISTDRGILHRSATGHLHGDGTCTVDYELAFAGADTRPARESHRMRYFSAEELEGFLEREGFRLLHLKSFPDLAEPSAASWNVIATARKA